MSWLELCVFYPLVALEWTLIAGACVGLFSGMVKGLNRPRAEAVQPKSKIWKDTGGQWHGLES